MRNIACTNVSSQNFTLVTYIFGDISALHLILVSLLLLFLKVKVLLSLWQRPDEVRDKVVWEELILADLI